MQKKISYGDEILEINGKTIKICDLITKESVSEKEASLKLKIKPKKGKIFEIIVEKKSTSMYKKLMH